MANNKNLPVSHFKVYESIIKERLCEINKLNMKIMDSSHKVLDSKESGLKQNEIEESIYSVTFSSKMDMLNALEKVNISSTPTDDEIEKILRR